MKWDKLNRRLFLQGAGKAALALPVLPSLIPRQAQASTEIKPRYINMFIPYGPVADATWYPAVAPSTRHFLFPSVQHSTRSNLHAPEHYIHTGGISSNSSGISGVFDSKFVAYKSKMNFFRGIDINRVGGHYGNRLLGDVTEGGSTTSSKLKTPSFDQIMAYANGFYPADATNVLRSIYTTIRKGHYPSEQMVFGFQNPLTRSGPIVARPNDYDPKVLFDKLFGSFGGPAPKSPTPLIDAVLADFRRVKNGRAISSDDRQRLDTHMDLLSQLEKKLTADAPACSVPTEPKAWPDGQAKLLAQTYVSDWGEQAAAFNDVVIAAFQCGINRVAIMNINYPLNWHLHNLTPQDRVDQLARHKSVADYAVYDLVRKMDGINEANGKTMLDNSLVHFNAGAGDKEHSTYSFPTVTFGSCGGFFKTGQYIDYRSENWVKSGLLNNQLLVNIMLAMGLQQSDWDMATLGLTGADVPANAKGYGDYFEDYYIHEAIYKYPVANAAELLPKATFSS